MAVRHFLHPVTLSRAVMEKSKHCVLCADGALAFARSIDFQTILENPDELKIPDANNRQATLPDEGYGDSVTAVALDSKGRMACAISTGGTPDKLMGRVGDAPLIGCGGYANEHGAVTACGHGESIIKMNLAKEIVHNIEKEQSAQEAAENAVKKVNSDSRVGRFVGVIAIDKGGNIGVKTNAAVMPWASIKDNKMKFGWHQNIFETVDI
ncbi:isoaspartyl peptidase/L-asparaginase-like [Dendronephthya gigantea]|uniref:isoaspartyl peptidase/L-asparaginase-like n=1 Tax=Dendronephthya gigantea TaxID=151771 RepID=UPI00106C392C|nr:isoaspartyl peptidase/L-asparaginase-like [Dendronephthya gigantea]